MAAERNKFPCFASDMPTTHEQPATLDANSEWTGRGLAFKKQNTSPLWSTGVFSISSTQYQGSLLKLKQNKPTQLVILSWLPTAGDGGSNLNPLRGPHCGNAQVTHPEPLTLLWATNSVLYMPLYSIYLNIPSCLNRAVSLLIPFSSL